MSRADSSNVVPCFVDSPRLLTQWRTRRFTAGATRPGKSTTILSAQLFCQPDQRRNGAISRAGRRLCLVRFYAERERRNVRSRFSSLRLVLFFIRHEPFSFSTLPSYQFPVPSTLFPHPSLIPISDSLYIHISME